jgi:signal transduction histidine kinase/ActR/RegA family two-component response regulator
MRLRSHLIALVLAALVPVLGFTALVMRENARLQLAATERGMRDTASAVARTVDKELETAITALEALAQSEHLDTGSLAPFYGLCERVTRTQGWVNILLFEADGRTLMQTSVPLGSPRPPTRRPDTLAEARDKRGPAVSNLFDGSVTRNVVAVYVPVVRNNVVRYVLAVGLRAGTFGELLRSQTFAPDTIAVLQDREATIIARTQGEAEAVGRRVQNPTPGREGWLKSRVIEGTEVYVAFATAPLSGWRVILTAPTATVEAPLRRGAWQLLAGAAVASALAAALAFLFGRRIEGAVGGLVRIAHAVERGDRAEPLQSGVTEVNQVAEQLSTAAELARAREQESALRERQARAIADVAHALAASPDLDTVLRTAVDAVRGLVRADSARIALVDEAGRLVVRYSTILSSLMLPGFEIAKGQGAGGLAWSTGRPVRTDDFRNDPRFRDSAYVPIAQGDNIVSCMTVPIVSSGAVVGVIYANNFTRRPFTDEEEAALVTLADHAAVAVEKARILAREHAARAEAEAASRGKDELLAMLGHELRNPLSAIANAVHVLEAGDSPAEVTRRAREIITRQNAHLAHLVDDLLDVARVTSGKIALVRRPLELSQAVRHALATLAAGGRTERHRVTVELEPVWADVDETRFEQIVNNLIGNALRFTPAAGTIAVTLRGEGGEAVLRVRDTGVGIAPEMLPRVFDLFAQGERGPDRGAGGLGLGLTLVRRITELHGGSVEAASPGAGHGSTFTVRLPALAAPAAPAPRSGAATPSDGKSRRILVVEDNTDAREMLRHLLNLAGHEVHEAPDAPAGLEAALRLRPDIALVDVGLPGFDGYQLARRVRGSAGPSIYLVALTGYGQPDDRRQAHQAGFDAHLVKPVNPEALLAVIQNAGQNAAQNAGRPAGQTALPGGA